MNNIPEAIVIIDDSDEIVPDAIIEKQNVDSNYVNIFRCNCKIIFFSIMSFVFVIILIFVLSNQYGYNYTYVDLADNYTILK